jgi:sugar/nucleoside kinase (ribokinase family)
MAEPPIVDVVGVGLNATDTLIPLNAFPQCGSKTEYSSSTIMPGGQVATTVVACQTWRLSTRYVGKLGDDDAARLHREAFACAAAAINCTASGARGGIQSVEAIQELMAKCPRYEGAYEIPGLD